jgi:translation initiation factor 5B
MVILNVIPGAIFKRKNPIIIGVNIIEGELNVGTTLFIENVELGVVTGIEHNHLQILHANNAMRVAISINSNTKFLDIYELLHG